MNHERFIKAVKALLNDDVFHTADMRWRLEQAVEIIEEQDELILRIRDSAINGCAEILRNVSGTMEESND